MVGNTPNFSKIDILRCFLMFDKNIGRQELSRELELGEGTIRTILDILKSKKLLDSTKRGHFLSKKGSEILSQIYERISMPKSISISLYPDLKKAGVVIRDSPSLKELCRIRDIAVKNGADGAVILKFDGGLYAPGADAKQDYSELAKYFDFKDNDALAIAFSNEKRNAENGSLAIAVELNGFIKKFISEL